MDDRAKCYGPAKAIGLWLLATLFLASGATAEPVRAGHMQAELIAEHAQVAPGRDILVAIRQIPDQGWHTYWINPGETGLAAQATFDLPEGVTAGPLAWPTPERLPYGGVITYGYTRPATLLVSLHAAAYLQPGEIVPIKLRLDSLVCAETCEPVSFDLATTVKIGPTVPTGSTPFAGLTAQLPKALATETGMTQTDGMVSVGLVRPADRDAQAEFNHPQGAYLFSENDQILSPAAVQTLSLGARGFSFLVKDSAVPIPSTPQAFVVRFADGKAWRLSVSPGVLPAGTYDIGSPAKAEGPGGSGAMGLAMILAFAGGLILNLMPCVFPVLSMKLLALTRAGHDKGMARFEAVMYGAGAIASFVGLSLILDLARAAGASLGWGFQLQSPVVTAALSLLMLLVGLNMSGVFAVGGSLQAAAGERSVGSNPYIAAFLTGVLAVVVAAPCSAPFMATAMGVALAQGGMTSVAIFTALGLGFAAPFVVLTFSITLVPALARLMPRPGAWMGRLRHLLAIPMYLAALWMIWVFAQQTGPLAVAFLVGGLALVGLCLVSLAMPKVVRGSAWFIAILLCVAAVMQKPEPAMAGSKLGFSPQQISVWRAQNRPVLVDLTAAWCVTCKVNERVALSNPAVKAALKASHTVYMVGDWTHQDAAISDYIHQFGRSGVPLYVYYAAGGKPPVVLPQILTPDLVVKALGGQISPLHPQELKP